MLVFLEHWSPLASNTFNEYNEMIKLRKIARSHDFHCRKSQRFNLCPDRAAQKTLILKANSFMIFLDTNRSTMKNFRKRNFVLFLVVLDGFGIQGYLCSMVYRTFNTLNLDISGLLNATIFFVQNTPRFHIAMPNPDTPSGPGPARNSL